MRYIAPADYRQLLIACWWQTDLFRICSLQKHSLQPTRHSCHLRPQRFGSGNQQKHLFLCRGRQNREMDPTLTRVAGQAALWSPSMNEKDAIPQAMQEMPDWEDPLPARWPGPYSGYNNADFQLPPTQPVARRSKGSADCPNEVATTRINQYSGVRVSRNNQLFPSLHLATISFAHLAATQTITVMCPAIFLSRLCSDPHAQHGSGQRQSNRRMVITRAILLLRSPIFRKSVPRFRGRSPACGQSHRNRSRKVKTKRQPRQQG